MLHAIRDRETNQIFIRNEHHQEFGIIEADGALVIAEGTVLDMRDAAVIANAIRMRHSEIFRELRRNRKEIRQ